MTFRLYPVKGFSPVLIFIQRAILFDTQPIRGKREGIGERKDTEKFANGKIIRLTSRLAKIEIDGLLKLDDKIFVLLIIFFEPVDHEPILKGIGFHRENMSVFLQDLFDEG
jgi:hypothetical protein